MNTALPQAKHHVLHIKRTVFLPNHCMEVGRCLLASSHAGTRLPIADLIQDQGRSPSVRRLLADSVFLLSQSMNLSSVSKPSHKRFSQDNRQQNRRHPIRNIPCKNSSHDFLRRHYPHQVKGSKFAHFLSARQRAPLFFVRLIITHLGDFSSEEFLLIQTPVTTHKRRHLLDPLQRKRRLT